MALYKTKETALKHLRNGQSFSNKAFDLFREDREIALDAMRRDSTFKCIPFQFRNDPDFAESLLCNMKSGGLGCLEMQSIGFDLLKDRDFIFKMMGKISYLLATELYMASGYDVKFEYDICLRLVEHQPAAICLIPDPYRNDDAILLAFASQCRDSCFRTDHFKRLINELDLPDIDSDELLSFIKSRSLNRKLGMQLCTKVETKRTIKI
jgi:hypothetical protein